ncbi:MAG TPA: hypothetical protein VEI57_13025 [Nitrospirota bacterium]|nr:hypothetical protein [Nitrospirota bacterium]
MKNFTDYLEQYALFSIEKQFKLARIIGEQMHELDLDAGVIRFSRDLSLPFQVLGTESFNTLTWLWAWAEEQTEIPENLIQTSLQLRDWGVHEGIREFTMPSVDIDKADGKAIAIVSTQIASANSWFRDSYEGGAVYLLIFDKSIENEPSFDKASLFTSMTDILSRYELNQKNVLLSYLQMKILSPIERGTLISCELENGERLNAEFDDAGKLRGWDGKVITD